MSTYLMNRTETVEVAPSNVEHVQGTYNGWTLAVDTVEIRFRESYLDKGQPRHDVKITLHCARLNKHGVRGAARVTEEFRTGVSKATAVPRWAIPILLDHKPAWFTGKLAELFEGTDRCTVDTARGPLLTWRAPR